MIVQGSGQETAAAKNALYACMTRPDPAAALAFIKALHPDDLLLLEEALGATGCTALHLAIQQDWQPVISALIAKGAPLETSDAQGMTPLHKAVAYKNVFAMKALIDAGVAPDLRNTRTGDTPLQQAIREKCMGTVFYLLAVGADPALEVIEDKTTGKNACHLAVTSTPQILAHMLVACDKTLFTRFFKNDQCDIDALRLAIQDGCVDSAALLAEYGYLLNAPDPQGDTALHFLIAHRITAENGLALLDVLYRSGADMRAVSDNGDMTLLMAAAQCKYSQAFFFALERGADPFAVSRTGDTALHYAARAHNIDMLQVLIDAGVPLDARNNAGQTAFHIAAHQNRKANVVALLAAGANPLLTDKRGHTAAAICQGPLQAATRNAVVEGEIAWRRRHGMNQQPQARNNGRRGVHYTGRMRGKIPPSKPGQNKR